MKNKIYYKWVDWMKVLGIYLIIVGHFFPLGNQIIYMFSVPLFFFISGFLSKTNETEKVFWSKLFRSLVLPLLIIFFFIWCVIFLERLCDDESISTKSALLYWVMVMIGQQNGVTDFGGLGACWFIYTLILLKVVNHLISKLYMKYLVLFICVCVASFFHVHEIKLYSAFADITVSYPFFFTGYIFQKYYLVASKQLNIVSMPWKRIILVIVVLFIVLFLLNKINGTPMVYRNEYGADYLLFYCGGMIGTFIVFLLSSKLSFEYDSKIVTTLSVGTIIILGFHGLFIDIIRYISDSWVHLYLGITSYFFAILILFLFYPIIIVCSRYFSVILGCRKCER